MEKIGLAAVLDMDDFNRNMAKYDSALGQMDKTTDAAAKKVGLHFGGIGTAVENVALVIAGAFVGIGASIGATAVEGLKSFAGFEKGMNEVFTLLPGVTKTAMEKMTNDVQAFNKKFGTLSEESVPALYQALSAGVPPGNVFDFLDVAQKAALGGVSTLETAVDGLTSVTNAYGQDVISTGEASDLMFTTVRLGKTTFDELSKSLFNVVPVAAGLGIEFGEVTAALSSMTKQGVPTSVATTQLRQLFVELSKSGSAVSDTFTTLSGTSFRDFIAGGGDVQKALQILEQGAQDTGVGISDLFGSVEAGSAALILTGKGTAVFSSDLAAMDKSAGATQAAFETMDKGIFRSVDKIKSSFQVMMQDVGEKLAPVFAQLANWVQTNMPAVETTVVGVFSSIADWAMAKLPGALQALQDAFNYVRDVVIPLVQEHFSAFVRKMEEVRDVLIPLAKEQLANFILKAQELWDMIAPMIVTIGGWVTAFANMDSGQRDLILTFAAVILAVGPVVSAISGLSAIIGGIVAVGGGAVTALTGAGGVAASLLGLLTPVGWVVAAVGGLALAWATDFGGIRTGTIAQVEYIGGLLSDFGESVKTKIETGIENAKTAWNTTWDNISGKVATVAVTIGEAVTTFGGNVKTAISTAIDNAKTAWNTGWDSISSKVSTIAGTIGTALTTFGESVKSKVATGIDNAKTAWNTTWDSISSKVSTIAGTIGTALSTFGESVKSKVQTGIDNAKTAWNTTWDSISGKVSTISGTIGTALSTFGESVKSKVQTGIDNAKTAWATGWDNISSKVSTIAGTIGTALFTFGESVKSKVATGIDNAKTAWNTTWDSISGKVSTIAGTIGSAVSSLGGNVQSALSTSMHSALSSWGTAWENVRSTISNKAYDIAAAARSAGSGAVDTLRSGWESGTGMFARAVQSVAGSISGYFEEKSNHWLTAGRNVIEGVSTGISNRAGGLYAQMQSVANSVLGTFKSALGIRSPSEVFAEAGYNIAAGLAQGITEGQSLVSEAMARLQNQTQLELNQYSAMVDNQLAATIARYQQGLAQGQAQDSIRQGFDQGQYAAYWAAIQAGESEASALAAGQAVPRTPPSTGSTGGGSAPATGGGGAAAPVNPLMDWSGSSSAALAALQSLGLNMNGSLTTYNGYSTTGWSNAEATAKLVEVADLVTKVLGGDFSKMTDALTKIREFAPENRFGNDVQVKLGVLQQQMMSAFAQFQAEEAAKAAEAPKLDSSLIGTIRDFVARTFRIGAGDLSADIANVHGGNVTNRTWGMFQDAENMGLDDRGQTAANVFNATKMLSEISETSSLDAIKDALSKLVDFRNLQDDWTQAQSRGFSQSFGDVTREGNTFNVTFTGNSSDRASVIQDIQFLNSLYGAT